MCTVTQQKQWQSNKIKACRYWNRNIYTDMNIFHVCRWTRGSVTLAHALNINSWGLYVMEASEGRLVARSPISNSILFTLPMQLHQMQPSLKSRYDRHSRGWNFFVSTPSTFFFSPLHPPSGHAPLPLHPPQTPLVGLPRWIEERGLTKVSMVTVHSVNHAAADVSSPSLFPFSSLYCCQPHACTNPSLSVSSPVV